MNLSASEKVEVIRMVKDSALSIRKTLEELGISRSSFYRWYQRYQVALRLLEVSRLLGHSTVKMTERYAHLAPDSLESAVGLLDQRAHSGHTDRRRIDREVVSH